MKKSIVNSRSVAGVLGLTTMAVLLGFLPFVTDSQAQESPAPAEQTVSLTRPSRRVLILGGTSEARELAVALDRAGVAVVMSLAGRLSMPRAPAGDVRSGGFGGPAGLASWLVEHGVVAVVDATHPFAERISASAVTACTRSNIPLLRLERPPWRERPGDRWHRVDNLEAAADLVSTVGRRAWLTREGH